MSLTNNPSQNYTLKGWTWWVRGLKTGSYPLNCHLKAINKGAHTHRLQFQLSQLWHVDINGIYQTSIHLLPLRLQMSIRTMAFLLTAKYSTVTCQICSHGLNKHATITPKWKAATIISHINALSFSYNSSNEYILNKKKQPVSQSQALTVLTFN